MAKPALGRGLGALLGGNSPLVQPAPATPITLSPPPAADTRERVQRIVVSRIHRCPFQPRQDFSEESLRELADSIKEQGIVQPLLVRSRGEDFELIAGERRWRAAQLLGLTEVPAIVREADDRTVLELALIENLQRENLNPIEEALGYSQLIEQFQLLQEEAAAKVGKSRTVVANALRLLKLPAEIQNHIRHSRLSVGHAKVILGLPGAEEQTLAVERVLKDGLTVRQTEDLVAHWQDRSAAGAATQSGKPRALLVRSTHVVDLENRLRERLGTKVQLRYRQGKGALEIRFFSDTDLERVLQIIGLKMD